MIFDVIAATHSLTSWADGGFSQSLKFEVVPNERYRIDFGEQHVLLGSGYHRFMALDRKPVRATISITANPAIAAKLKEKETCGSASFHRGMAELAIYLTVEPALFEAIAALRIDEPGAATINASIKELEFGSDPDGSHQVWKLEDGSDLIPRKPVSDFWLSVANFSTTEQAVIDATERRFNDRLAASHDPEERKLAGLNVSHTPNPVIILLSQCRWLLVVLIIIGAILAWQSIGG